MFYARAGFTTCWQNPAQRASDFARAAPRKLFGVKMVRTASLLSAYIVALMLMAAAYAFAPASGEVVAVSPPSPIEPN
jgi:hypothetical protein